MWCITLIDLRILKKKAGVAILISDKIDFKTKAVKRDKEGHYIPTSTIAMEALDRLHQSICQSLSSGGEDTSNSGVMPATQVTIPTLQAHTTILQ